MLYGLALEPLDLEQQKMMAIIAISQKLRTGASYRYVGPLLSAKQIKECDINLNDALSARLCVWFDKAKNLVFFDIVENSSQNVLKREEKKYSRTDLLLIAKTDWF